MASNTNHPKSPESAVKALTSVLEHVALEDDVTDAPTDDDRQWAATQVAQTQQRLNALRRERTPRRPELGRAVHVPDELRALARPELIAQLSRISQLQDIGFAHRNLTGLTDDDLRQLLAVGLAAEK